MLARLAHEGAHKRAHSSSACALPDHPSGIAASMLNVRKDIRTPKRRKTSDGARHNSEEANAVCPPATCPFAVRSARPPCTATPLGKYSERLPPRRFALTKRANANTHREDSTVQARNDELSLQLLEMSGEKKRLEEKCKTTSAMLEREQARLHTYTSLYNLEKTETSECRVRLAELEEEQIENHSSRVRLLNSLASYRAEVGSLEELIESMENHSEATIARLCDECEELRKGNASLSRELRDMRIESGGVWDIDTTCNLKHSLGAVIEDFWTFSSHQVDELAKKRTQAQALTRRLLDQAMPEERYAEPRKTGSCPYAMRYDMSRDVSSDSGVGLSSDALDPRQSMIATTAGPLP